MMQRAIHFLQKDTAIWGPLLLLCTLAIGAKTAIPFDLLFLTITGLYLCARWQVRGCCYALALLGISAAVKHAFVVTDHLWELGIEGSLACAYFITALAFEQGAIFIESLKSQMETGKAALGNLEEELSKTRENSQEMQIVFQEKVATLQKELEELQTDHSSILILNEVLRKTTARHIQESEELTARCTDVKEQMQLLKREYAECQKELSHISNTEEMALQNKELLKELNEARFQREQTHLINETLARLYARENLKAKDADQEAASLADQLAAARKLEREEFPQEKMVHLMQIEPLFKQLKKQFDEKNQILQQTRTDLFKTDTELQKLRMEKAALELSPVPKDVEEELQGLGEQIQTLEEENQQLQELITILTKGQPAEKKK